MKNQKFNNLVQADLIQDVNNFIAALVITTTGFGYQIHVHYSQTQSGPTITYWANVTYG